MTTEGTCTGYRGSNPWPHRENAMVTEGALAEITVTVRIMSCRPGSKLGLGPTWQDDQAWIKEWGLDQKWRQEARHSGTDL